MTHTPKNFLGTYRGVMLFVFVFFLIINFISSGGHTDMWDGMVTFLVTESMALKHTAQLHPEIPSISNASTQSRLNVMVNFEVGNYKALIGKYYEWLSQSSPVEPVFTSRSLLLPAISVPFYFIATIIPVDAVSLVSLSVNSVIIAITGLVLFAFALDLYGSRRIAFVLGLIFFGCSFILPYNTSLFPQPLQGLCIISGIFFLHKVRHVHPNYLCQTTLRRDLGHKTRYAYCVLSASLIGFSVIASPISGLFIPAYIICSIVYLRRNKKLLLSFLMTLAVLMILVGTLNYIRFGSFAEFGYGSLYGTFSLNTEWQGLLGLLLSPGKGLIFYFPLVVLLPLAIKFSFRQNPSLSFLTVYILVVLWLYFGTLLVNGESRSWSGAIAWGPRYLVPLLPLIALLIGGLFKYPRNFKIRRLIYLSIVLFSVAGFIINLGGILVWSEYGLIYASEREGLGGFAWELMTWDAQYSPIVIHMKMLLSNHVSSIPLEEYRDTAWDFALYGLAPCQYDLYILCKFGVVPVVLLSCIAVLFAILILVRNNKEEYVYS
jgi:hypothetical protein